jgi:hypothetical protein
MVAMPMREDCKHFQSRTYGNGEVARMCELDLAPEAPWRCPDACPAYARRLMDVNWSHGTLVTPPAEDEPAGFDADSIALLDEADDIVNAVAPETLTEVERARARADASPGRRLRGLFRRRR